MTWSLRPAKATAHRLSLWIAACKDSMLLAKKVDHDVVLSEQMYRIFQSTTRKTHLLLTRAEV